MDLKSALSEVEAYLTAHFESIPYSTHHQDHVYRVREMCRYLGGRYNADNDILEIAAMLHDIGRAFPQCSDHALRSAEMTETLLRDLKVEQFSIHLVTEAIRCHSYSKGRVPVSLEGRILQDADRLDALGAIGIIRVISHDNKIPLYDMNDPFAERRSLGKSPLDHFYQKIVHLKNGFHTPEAQKPALKRHRFVLAFLDQLKQEIFLIAG
ncbi:MAG: HD domain-containing protein [Nitrospina sp.]|jgi:uncharacterized protein|nr:HD domain-containing protein [Nitrospina sp.]